MVFDLHSHSNYSDGILSPEALMSRAKERGVTVLALTDHDTIAGIGPARQAAAAEDMTLIAGIEFSSQWGKSGIHVLGLGVNPESPELLAAVAQQQDAREARAKAIAVRLAQLGIPGALEGAQALAGGQVGRPHFAQYLVAGGYVRNEAAAFKKYLGAGKPADVKFQWPEMAQVIGWIHGSGGVAVLAHPYKYPMTRTKRCALVADFAQAGGDGLEVISGQQASGVAEDLAKLADTHQLAASCGSDFHRPDAPWQELGNFGTLPARCRPIWSMLGYAA
ncbi:PHP domain-containing protein [Marinimicrobium sp. ABcell2]|uniref:PHP domain-containing protein n=1 Tax=Marinimicrobium sp. ABcell2 TaxID=3069751 RepID=UPI0027B3CC5D|nr:PHP domain-containing protein [Marinimicrobium sp. ABcell2]MDQ2075555.1 PHP domain-containing protein [Marinimicrobium sp. ABcell2]